MSGRPGGWIRGWPWVVVGGCLVVAGVAAGGRATRVGRSSRAVVAGAIPAPARGDRYATSDACRACHPGAYATWHRTFHRSMTQPAGPESIAGRFDGAALDAHGRVRASRDDDAFFVSFPDPAGSVQRHRVVMVTGSHHMQVYWVRPDADDGRLVSFPYAFLIPEQTWVPNESTLLRPTDEAVRYTWNRVCIKCHAVAGIPGYDAPTDIVQTGVAELGIACEACHGPAGRHAAAHRDPLRRYAGRLSDASDPTVVNPASLPADRASQICAQCHGITVFADEPGWIAHGHDAAPPDPVSAWGTVVRHPLEADQRFADALLDDDPDYFANRFWDDGMVRVSGREYNGIAASPCAASEDFGCLSCHRMHDSPPDDQLADADPDAACRRCHAEVAAQGAGHTHHAADSSGSRCVNCHMPHTTYGLLGAIRSHEISSPRATEVPEVGRPDACSLCHVDRPLGWVATSLHAWFDHDVPDVPAETSTIVELLLAGDAGQRALAAWHLSWAPAVEAGGAEHWAAPLLAELLDDPYPAVRLVAARSLQRLPNGPAIGLREVHGFDRQDVAAVQASLAPAVAGPTVPVVTDPTGRDRIDAMRQRRNDRPVALAE